jgi:hypothetical protein
MQPLGIDRVSMVCPRDQSHVVLCGELGSVQASNGASPKHDDFHGARSLSRRAATREEAAQFASMSLDVEGCVLTSD